ncbi:alpha-N-acetylglucosaminidase TIM-barrel domain-containing protein [Spongiactinospora gelatinilytica]|uniref:alpha-N-acetylglucosaminidase TIM-barrel domain-containing protein n=1 Tax=Spongiactinospora gelatinilytica TaxID=2666298 RepID=UPI0018F6F4BB|nr:alpha-N-acetylglucosaminidase TIM-barrel domain-containing protein [Spongiactinospora gelatinilytica]
MLEWIVPPSHQAWQWLNNIHSFGGGTTRGLAERRAELAVRVLGRMRELGIRPILPGFSGTVPDGFAERNPGARTVPQGKWFMDVAGPQRPDWLDTSMPAYARVAEAFYRHQRERFGHHNAWAVDLLHEGGILRVRAKRGRLRAKRENRRRRASARWRGALVVGAGYGGMALANPCPRGCGLRRVARAWRKRNFLGGSGVPLSGVNGNVQIGHRAGRPIRCGQVPPLGRARS